MSARNDGGAAFPSGLIDPATPEEAISPMHAGMSLRDYFAAHAPAEPQPWFKPVMPEECPQVDYKAPFDLTDEEREQMSGLGSWIDVSDITLGRLREFLEHREAQKRAVAAWNREHSKQVYVQWPWAWADSVLKAREA